MNFDTKMIIALPLSTFVVGALPDIVWLSTATIQLTILACQIIFLIGIHRRISPSQIDSLLGYLNADLTEIKNIKQILRVTDYDNSLQFDELIEFYDKRIKKTTTIYDNGRMNETQSATYLMIFLKAE